MIKIGFPEDDLKIDCSEEIKTVNWVYSPYFVVPGVHKWERNILGDCHEPKLYSIFQHVHHPLKSELHGGMGNEIMPCNHDMFLPGAHLMNFNPSMDK